MAYKAERWAPLPIPVDVFLIALESTEDIKTLLGATSVRVAYNRGGTILVEWTMMHRETFAGLVGQYIIRKPNGEFQILDSDELMSTFAPVIDEKTEDEGYYDGMDKLGKITAVYEHDGTVEEILFELPDGTPATFTLKTPEEAKAEAEATLEKIKPEKNVTSTEEKLRAYVDDNGIDIDVVKKIHDKDLTHTERPIPGPPKNYNKEKTDG